MADPVTVLVVVPARGGSKGIPAKNLRPVGGLSLVARAVVCGRLFLRHTGLDHGSVLVDTDDPAIAEEAMHWGGAVPFLRPADLAQDTTSSYATVRHATARWERERGTVGTIVLLQPTSPLRIPEDVSSCWAACRAGAASAVTVTRETYPPEKTLSIRADGTAVWRYGEPKSHRRQDAETTWRLTGAVYVQEAGWLARHQTFFVSGESVAIEIPPERSIDIDRPLDLIVAGAVEEAMEPTARRRHAYLPLAQPDRRPSGPDGLHGGTGVEGIGRVAVSQTDPEGGGLGGSIPLVVVTAPQADAPAVPHGAGVPWLLVPEGAEARAFQVALALHPRPVTLIAEGPGATARRLEALARLAGWSAGFIQEGTTVTVSDFRREGYQGMELAPSESP